MRARDYFEKYDTLIMEEQKNGEIGTTKKLLPAVCMRKNTAFRCYWMTAMPELAGKL